MTNRLPALQPVAVKVDSCVAHEVDENGPTGKKVTVERGDEFFLVDPGSDGKARVRDPQQKTEHPCLMVNADDIENIERISAAPHAVAI